jgi:hypothetical protein
MRAKPQAGTCADCHVDVHRGTFRQDCKTCHSESSFENAPFDHAKTKFSLTGSHGALACVACHKDVVTTGVPRSERVADFRGLKTACTSCHRDVHSGQLGAQCETCHTTSNFHIRTYTHTRFSEFFAGEHAPVACDRCHVREAARRAADASAPLLDVTFKNLPTSCATCHRDVHLGQEGTNCEACHNVQTAKFAASGFAHEKTAFPLTGRHGAVRCDQCHKPETGGFPARSGTAVRYKGVPAECRACHADVHLGQLAATCENCHTTTTFKQERYKHRSTSLAATGFFSGRHAAASCEQCHKPVAGRFPAGNGTAIQYRLDPQCVTCHRDVHFGALGSTCERCHHP